ncbi:hypothetical protein DFH06DRAFT_1428698 [Mycena polygramma]|nr:hypothetical protein DFH06DRAFT_1428698 [Mycena polygramma]
MEHEASGTSAELEEEKAQAFIEDLAVMNEGLEDRKTFTWPILDYSKLSSSTLGRMSVLLADLGVRFPEKPTAHSTPVRNRHHTPIPETPHHIQIARLVDLQLAQRSFSVAFRKVQAKTLETDLRAHAKCLYKFLQAACQDSNETIVYPSKGAHVVESIAAIRRTLEGIEDIMKVNMDKEATEPDSEDDADKTRVHHA